MIVCSCNVLSERAIRDACTSPEQAPRTPGQVYRCLGCSPQCGRCSRTIRSIINEALAVCPAACAVCPNHDHAHDVHADNDVLPHISELAELDAAE
ncbi:(2Fe-2S)-binding protein [Terrihabitans rhizophilus]|uniref:Bacterioferritin-associated ferredoxin n=1 Tax=Terrihabitans rhizophilus TaxID=3092662 RepID=A0ABU4RPU7_9HYPH|nr:(2Fe-2S)-binding protein [Terrihabitans sp. PJ23]MDX6806857.1 (2Fe-2S)-binding protein [Terrihabitans sp. PJ23]